MEKQGRSAFRLVPDDAPLGSSLDPNMRLRTK